MRARARVCVCTSRIVANSARVDLDFSLSLFVMCECKLALLYLLFLSLLCFGSATPAYKSEFMCAAEFYLWSVRAALRRLFERHFFPLNHLCKLKTKNKITTEAIFQRAHLHIASTSHTDSAPAHPTNVNLFFICICLLTGRPNFST